MVEMHYTAYSKKMKHVVVMEQYMMEVHTTVHSKTILELLKQCVVEKLLYANLMEIQLMV